MLEASVPYKRKKVRKVRNFFFWHFCTEILQIPAFFLPNWRFCLSPKTVDSRGSRCLALVCRRNRGEKLENSHEGPFFFFFFGDHIEPGQKC